MPYEVLCSWHYDSAIRAVRAVLLGPRGRACDYVRLIGVLARENASFIATHVREQHNRIIARR